MPRVWSSEESHTFITATICQPRTQWGGRSSSHPPRSSVYNSWTRRRGGQRDGRELRGQSHNSNNGDCDWDDNSLIIMGDVWKKCVREKWRQSRAKEKLVTGSEKCQNTHSVPGEQQLFPHEEKLLYMFSRTWKSNVLESPKNRLNPPWEHWKKKCW